MFEQTVQSHTRPAAVAAQAVTKTFPGVVALQDVSFDVAYGEIHAVVGENGAGKSTLVKLLAGLLQPDSGRLVMDGNTVVFPNRRAALRMGMTVVPQDILTVPELSAGRNMLLGFEGLKAPRQSLSPSEAAVIDVALQRIHANFPSDTPASTMSVPELRLMQIARSLIRPGGVIVLDEPTAVLSESDADNLLERLARLRQGGRAIIYISHRLNEVLRIAQRVTVLRDGRNVGTFLREDIDREAIIALMADRERRGSQQPESIESVSGSPSSTAESCLCVEALSRPPDLADVTLTANRGQIVGVAGAQGSGHGHLLRAIAGVDEYDRGRVIVNGRALPSGSVRDAYKAGVVLVPADRRHSAIVPLMSVRENLALPVSSQTHSWGIRRLRLERALVKEYVRALSLRTPSGEAPAGVLSGGNQQKLALARAFEARPQVLLLEEPTQGIDINAKREIARMIHGLAREQRLALVIGTSEFEDLLDVADVIHVMRLGKLVATLPARDTSYAEILHSALP